VDSSDWIDRTHGVYIATVAWLSEHRWIALALIVAGFGLLVFGEFADELNEDFLPTLDRAILAFLSAFRSDVAYDIAVALSALMRFPWVVLITAPFVLYVLFARHYRTAAIVVGVPLLTMELVELVKGIFGRERPLTAVVPEIGYSFPSGHATGATVLYGLLGYVAWCYMAKRPWSRAVVAILTLALIIGTGLARIYLQVHFLSDVLAGWSAGLFILMGTIVLLETRVRDYEPKPGAEETPEEDAGS
jgi:undecaprenyl-diphosphatase